MLSSVKSKVFSKIDKVVASKRDKYDKLESGRDTLSIMSQKDVIPKASTRKNVGPRPSRFDRVDHEAMFIYFSLKG
jgi:hypothetical protein